MESDKKAGSATLFFIIKLLNIVFGMSALTLIGLGIWLWRQLNTFSILEIFFISLGLFEFILVLLIWTAKKSVVRLRIYLYILIVLFVLQLTVIIVCFATGDKIIEKLAEKTKTKQQIEELKKHLNVIVYFSLGTLCLMLLQIGFTYCYIGSLRNRNNEFDYKIMDEQGNKMSLQEKNALDRANISQKYNQKREDLYNKYPKYRELKQGA